MTNQTSEGPRSKVAILGCATETRALAPFDDLSWEIWSHGAYESGENVKQLLPRWDIWFESHNPDFLPPNIKSHIEWLAEQTKPVMAWTPTGLLAGKEQFDWQPLVDKWGKEFLTSTTAWMMARAIVEGRAEIGLFGIEMSSDAEYAYQRAGVKHFQYIAEQYHGIKVTVPLQSELSRERIPYPFGLETPMALFVADLEKKGVAQMAALDKEIKILQEARDKLEGAQAIVDRVMRYHTYE